MQHFVQQHGHTLRSRILSLRRLDNPGAAVLSEKKGETLGEKPPTRPFAVASTIKKSSLTSARGTRLPSVVFRV